ncbi:MAG: Trehalose/maltose import ATP-binding protein MalK [Methanocella sp. PtaU1.Bin125]|nr:MAG: Trehalose/maltose import ATP-binding protein MalK [Methanocella sp. PtaU1.Bin125]
MIETQALGRRFGNYTAVEGLDLSVKAGEVFGFLGPNGAGKTTTVRMLACLIRPTAGTARVDGLRVDDPGDARRIRRTVGILTERSGFYDNLTAYKNLRFYADLYRVDRRKADARIDDMLDAFGMSRWKASAVGGFSKGMRQKLALIRCLVHDPKVLFFDEPTAGLDPESARYVRDAIVRLKQDGRTIFLCTHNLDEAERLCDRVAIVNRRLLYEGTPERLRDAAYGRRIIVRLERMMGQVHNAVSGLDAVAAVEESGDGMILEVRDPDRNCADVVDAIVRAGGRIRSVGELRHSLEDVYMKLVGDRCEH